MYFLSSRILLKPMLFANNYDVQFNANGMNNMEQFGYHNIPLLKCGTSKTTIHNDSTITVAADLITDSNGKITQDLQKHQRVQHNESLQVFDNSLLNQLIITEENKNFHNLFWPKKHKRQQNLLSRRRPSLLRAGIKKQNFNLFQTYTRFSWHHIPLKI